MGTVAEIWSSRAQVRVAWPGIRLGSKSCPTIACPAGAFTTAAFSATSTASRVLLVDGEQSTPFETRAEDTRCRCGSTKPGMITPALCSSTLVPVPTKPSRSLREPTARMRPPATAIASALGTVPSMVINDPMTRRSALAADPRRCGWAVRSAGATSSMETRAALAGWGAQQLCPVMLCPVMLRPMQQLRTVANPAFHTPRRSRRGRRWIQPARTPGTSRRSPGSPSS